MIEGFVRYDKDKLVYDSRTDGFIKHVRSVYEDSDNVIWLGTMDGLYSFNGKKYTFRGDSIQEFKGRITKINGRKGQLWVGTRSDGIIVLTPDSVLRLNENNNLCGNMIRLFIWPIPG